MSNQKIGNFFTTVIKIVTMVTQMIAETEQIQKIGNVDSLCFIALPRTGTNYICSLIHHFKEIDSFFEIFHRKSVYIGSSQRHQKITQEIIEDINNKYNFKISSSDDSTFVDFVHQNPEYLLKAIRAKSHKKYISFKVFINHLEGEKLQSCIIENQKIKKIIIKRNLLDTYISDQFAQKLQTWTKADTSRLYISFEEKKFINWYQRQQEFYDFVEKQMISSDQQIISIDYEEIHKLDSDRDKFLFMFDVFKQSGLEISQDNINAKILDQKFPPKTKKILQKQDNRESSLDKFSNPEELQFSLKKLNLEYLLH